MDEKTMLVRIAAILTTMLETGGTPESMLYIFCDMNMDDWTKLRYVLTTAGFVSIKGNYVTLTQKGKTTAEQINVVTSN